jgi:xylulokinase
MAGADWRRVRLGGGGASSSLWPQIFADALGKGVDQLAGARTTNARGAAFLALERLGHITLEDIPSMLEVAGTFDPQHDAYAPLIGAFIDAHTTTRPFYERLNRRPR